MKREWQPGDVVTATVNGRENVRLVAGWSKYDPRLRWCEMSPRWADGDDDDCWFMPNAVTAHRRLVAIDPEDIEAVREIWIKSLLPFDQFQAHLREFANPTPPRPDEPLGLGAVVRAADGLDWIRWSLCDEMPWVDAVGINGDTEWDDIPAVRILSEGVTP